MKYPRLASLFALVLTTALLWCSHAPAQRLVNITDPQNGTGIAYKANAKAISAAYTMTRSDHTLLANATSAAFTIGLLPAGTNQTNQIICIQKNDSTANAITIDGSGSETIDGTTTITLSSPNESVFLQAGQSSWHILARNHVQRVITQATTATLTADQLYGSTFINTGASGAIVLTLPAPQVGMRFRVYLTAAQDVDINPADSTQILALTNAAGDAISSAATIGNAIELVALSATTWGAFFTSGTFTDVN
jgi:hypothetical protein